MEDRFILDNTVPGEQKPLREEGLRKPSLLLVGVLYSIAVLLLIFVGSRVQSAEFYSGILITEFVLVFAPALALLILFRYDIKRVLRLNAISLTNAALIVGIMIFAMPLVGVLNAVNLVVIKSIFGKLLINQPPVAADFTGLLLNILVIGGAAGICEEVLFRGTIQRGFERFGAVKAILFTSLLFGLMHVDFQKLLGTFLLGAIIGFIVYRSNSLYGGMLAHFTNNSAAVILAFLLDQLNKLVQKSGMMPEKTAPQGDLDFSALANLPIEQVIGAIVFWAIFILACAGVFTLLITTFIKRTSGKAVEIPQERAGFDKRLILGLLPGLAAVGFIYFVQGLRLRGISIQALEGMLNILGLK